MAEAQAASVTINPDDFLEANCGRIWTPERNAEAWERSYQALEQAVAHAPAGRRVIVVCGIQGAGKTSWIAAQPVSAEAIYFDAALPGARHRARVVGIAKRFGAPIDVVWIKTPIEIALGRNAQRPPDKMVPAPAIHSVAKRFEPPSMAEGFERVLIVEAGPTNLT